MKRKIALSFLSAALAVCLLVSAGVMTAFAVSGPGLVVEDDPAKTTTVDLTAPDASSQFAGVFAGAKGALTAGAATEVWDFDAEAGTATSKAELVESVENSPYDDWFYLYYTGAEYKNFYMEVTLQETSDVSGWSGLVYGVDDATKPVKQSSAGMPTPENPKGGLVFVQGEGDYTWQNFGIHSSEWNDTETAPAGYDGRNENVHHLKVYEGHIQYWLNDQDPVIVDLEPGADVLTTGNVGVAVTNKATAVKSFKVTELMDDGTVTGYQPAESVQVTGLTDGQTAEAYKSYGVEVSVLPEGANPEIAFSSSPAGAAYTNGQVYFTEPGEYTLTFASQAQPDVKEEISVTVTEPQGYITYGFTEAEMARYEAYFIAGNSGVGGTETAWNERFAVEDGVLRTKNKATGRTDNDYSILYLRNRVVNNFEIVFSMKGTGDHGWLGLQFAMKDKTVKGTNSGAFAMIQHLDRKATIWGGGDNGASIGGPHQEAQAGAYLPGEWNALKVRVLNGKIDFYVNDMATPAISYAASSQDLTGAISLFADDGTVAEFKDVYFAYLTDEGAVDPFTQVQSVAISNKPASAQVGDTLELQVTVSPAGASNDSVNYVSSDEDVATVDGSGKVTFLSEGQVTITAVSEDDPSKTDSFTVTVEGRAVPVSSVQITNKPGDAAIGETLTLSVDVAPADATDKRLEFESSDPTVATVSAEGEVRFVMPGEVTITATSVADGTKADSFTVTVQAPGYIAYKFANDDMADYEAYFIAGGSGNGGVSAKWNEYFAIEDGVLKTANTATGNVGQNYSALYLRGREANNFEIVYRARATGANGWFGIQFAMTNKTESGNQNGAFAMMQQQSKKATLWGGSVTGISKVEVDSNYAPGEWNLFKLRVVNGQVAFYVNDMATPVVTATAKSTDITGAISLFADDGTVAEFKDVYFAYLKGDGEVDPYTPIESVTINNKTAKATVGDRITLDVTVTPSAASEPELTFASETPTVAIINDEGVITCLTAGTTIIIVTSVSDPSLKDSFTLTVEAAAPADPDDGEPDGGNEGGDPSDKGETGGCGGCGSSAAGASLAAAGLALGVAVLALRKRNKESK